MEVHNQIEVNQELKVKNSSFETYNYGGNYVNQLRLYHAYFDKIPNIKMIRLIEITEMRRWISREMKNEIQHEHYFQVYEDTIKKNFYDDHFFLLKNDIVINLCQNQCYILFGINQEKEAQNLQNLLLKFKTIPKKTTQICLIINSNKGLTVKKIDIISPKLNFSSYYNEDFKKVHKNILKNLKKTKTKGLYLFHGLPGTGKSTYIKYLICQQSKPVIFIPPKIAGNLDDLSLTEFLLENQNSILVIEDAEDLIISRDTNQNSKLSFLLNLADGLISESLGIQIIATFNTDLKNIDKALLRKGRLSYIYDFKTLTIDKSNLLLRKLGHNTQVTQPMVLADIFNFEVNTNFQSQSKAALGFGN